MKRLWCWLFHRQYHCQMYRLGHGRHYVHPGAAPDPGAKYMEYIKCSLTRCGVRWEPTQEQIKDCILAEREAA